MPPLHHRRAGGLIASCIALAFALVSSRAALPAPLEGSATTGDADATVGQLQEITVTAQKRTEDVKDIPISVSAISAETLLEHHVADYDDITRTVPGVSFQAGAGPGLDNIEIRGVSSTSGSATVGIYIDEVSVTVSNLFDGAVQPKLFDLDRIEVLRGPQGTLYGASSMGGTIRFITKQPDSTAFSAGVTTDLSYTNHGGVNSDIGGVLNLPVVDGVFALRLSVDWSALAGYIDHYTPTPNGAAPDGSILQLATNDSTGVLGQNAVNSEHTEVFRLAGRYTPNDSLTLTPALLWQRTTTGDSSIFYPSIGLYDQDKRVSEPGRDVLTVPSLTLTANLGFADLTSISSYFQRDFHRTTDGTYYNSNIFANLFINGGPLSGPPYDPQGYRTATEIGFLGSPVYYETKTEQISQELRLSSRSASLGAIPVTWTAGLYYSDQQQTHLDDEFIPGLQAKFLDIYGYAIDSPSSPVAAPGVSYANDLIYFGHQHPSVKQIAPFGELGFEITPGLKAAVGLRYVSAKSSFDINSGGYYSYGLPAYYTDGEKFSATTPKASIDWAVNDHSNLYASVAKGFRLGGPTGPVPAYQPNGPGGTPGPCDPDYDNLGLKSAPKQFDSDSLWSYELGSKGRYFSNHLSVNAAVYAINWTNIQQTINLPTCGFNFTANVGDAKIYGSEFELRALVTPSLTLSLNAGTTHAYLSSISVLGAGIASVGEAVLNVPKYTVTPSADYDVRVGDATTLFVRADFPYTGRSRAYFDSSGLANLFSPAYGIFNLNVGVTLDKLSLGLYAKNLFGATTIIQYPSVNTVQEGYAVRPLTIGATANLKF